MFFSLKNPVFLSCLIASSPLLAEDTSEEILSPFFSFQEVDKQEKRLIFLEESRLADDSEESTQNTDSEEIEEKAEFSKVALFVFCNVAICALLALSSQLIYNR